MTLPAEAFLSSGGWQRYHKDHALRFFLLHNFLEEAGGQVGEYAAAASALHRVAAMSGAEIIAHGSSFFWYHVEGLYDCVTKGEPLPDDRLAFFLGQLFDSYFSLLEDGDSVTVAANEVILPCLGLSIPVGSQDCRVQRLDADRVGVTYDDVELTLEIASPGEHRLPHIEITPTAQLLFGVDSLLNDALASKELAKSAKDQSHELAEMLRQALDLIRVADEGLADRMASLVRWYFPIKTPDKRQVHNSFSIASLSGAIFLSESYSALPLAEATVHEFYHNELWLAMRVENHILGPRKETLYSPWREDARPLLGLYHGLYVFTGLLDFFAMGEREPTLRAHHEHFQKRRRRIYHQVRIGLAQVPFELLDERGREFIESLSEIVQRHGDELGAATDDAPNSLQDHWLKWAERYPELVSAATPPNGVAHQEAVP